MAKTTHEILGNQFDSYVRDAMKEHGVGYAEGVKIVARENPTIARAWRSTVKPSMKERQRDRRREMHQQIKEKQESEHGKEKS